MKYRKLRIAFSVTCGIACVLLYGCASPTQPQSPAPPAPPAMVSSVSQPELQPTPDKTTTTIPLGSIVSTSEQEGLERGRVVMREVYAKFGYADPFGGQVAELLKKAGQQPNVFLVDGQTITDAVTIIWTMGSWDPVDTFPVLNQPDPPRGHHWLFVFLGTAGSHPARWLVDSVTIDEKHIRFSYHISPSNLSTSDLHDYFYWVPLGMLDKGRYSLELYETKLKEVTRMRSMEVKALGER